MVTATLAASSRGKATTLVKSQSSRRSREGASDIPRKRERRQRCQRLGHQRAPWGENTHARVATRRETNGFKRQGSVCPSVIRRSVRECREALGPLINRTEPKTPWGVHVGESRVASRERTRYGSTQYHAGGRSRSDASRALPAGRSQGLVGGESSRALARRKLEAPPDVGQSREKAKRCAETH